MNVSKKIVLVTGASRGIGMAIASERVESDILHDLPISLQMKSVCYQLYGKIGANRSMFN